MQKFGDVEKGGKLYYFKDDLEKVDTFDTQNDRHLNLNILPKAFLSISSDEQGILRRVADRIRSFAIAQVLCLLIRIVVYLREYHFCAFFERRSLKKSFYHFLFLFLTEIVLCVPLHSHRRR